jgi:hypothetical protein
MKGLDGRFKGKPFSGFTPVKSGYHDPVGEEKPSLAGFFALKGHRKISLNIYQNIAKTMYKKNTMCYNVPAR